MKIPKSLKATRRDSQGGQREVADVIKDEEKGKMPEVPDAPIKAVKQRTGEEREKENKNKNLRRVAERERRARKRR